MGDYGQYIVPTADEMINFKVGQPAESMLPLEMIREASAAKMAEQDRMFLQYGHLYGYPKFRASLAKFLSEGYNMEVDAEKLFVTNGVTGGISLLCSLFVKAGDLVFLEEPSYFLALSIMKDFNLNVKQIPMEEDGLDVDALEATLKRGIIPKLMYTIPTCHNPTGRTMSVRKRERLVELSHEYGFLIVADEVYQLLSFPHVTPPPPMSAFDKYGTVLALGSFSKILAPSLRLGWIQASSELLKKITGCGQLDSSGGINPIIQGIVHSAIDLGLQKKHLEWTKQTLWERANALMGELKKTLPQGTTFEVPDGGYFILVHLPKHLHASELLEEAAKSHKVMFLPGANFAASMKNCLRLSFSWYSIEDLCEGARRLAAAIRAMEAKPKISSEQRTQAALSSSTRIAVHGAKGRLGSLIVSEAEKDSEVEFVGEIVRLENTITSDASVVIDVTLPEGTKALVASLESNPKPLVIGTTGDLPIKELREYSKKAPVCIKSNFSVGVPLLAELSKQALNSLPAGWSTEILEVHHTAKLDAPSGTAKTLQRAMRSTGVELVNGPEIPCKALRLGDEIGQHTVYLAGPGERIELKHQATRREVFALGALRTAKWIVNQPNGLYSL